MRINHWHVVEFDSHRSYWKVIPILDKDYIPTSKDFFSSLKEAKVECEIRNKQTEEQFHKDNPSSVI